MPGVSVTGIVRPFNRVSLSVAVTLIGSPSSTGFGDADNFTVTRSSGGVSVSSIVIVIGSGFAGSMPEGKGPILTVNVSSSKSLSLTVLIILVPFLAFAGIVITVEITP